MAALTERVASLERTSHEHTHMVNGLREAIASLEGRVVALEERMDRRFEAIDRRFDGVDGRFAGIDLRLSALDDKVSRQFIWLVGIQVTTLAAIVASFGAVVSALAAR